MNVALDRLFADMPPIMSAPAVAELLGMTNQGLYKWLKDGVIPGYKLSNGWLILRDELKEALQRGANRTDPADSEDLPL